MFRQQTEKIWEKKGVLTSLVSKESQKLEILSLGARSSEQKLILEG